MIAGKSEGILRFKRYKTEWGMKLLASLVIPHSVAWRLVLLDLESVFIGRDHLVVDVVFDGYLNVVKARLEILERD